MSLRDPHFSIEIDNTLSWGKRWSYLLLLALRHVALFEVKLSDPRLSLNDCEKLLNCFLSPTEPGTGEDLIHDISATAEADLLEASNSRIAKVLKNLITFFGWWLGSHKHELFQVLALRANKRCHLNEHFTIFSGRLEQVADFESLTVTCFTGELQERPSFEKAPLTHLPDAKRFERAWLDSVGNFAH